MSEKKLEKKVEKKAEEKNVQQSERKKKKKKRIMGFVSLELDAKTTERMRTFLTQEWEVDQKLYKTVRDEKHLAHVTLAFHTDAGFSTLVENHYKAHVGKEFPFQVWGFVRDQFCVALLVNEKDFPLPYLPANKKLHITMMLKDKPAVYSNELIQSEHPDERVEMGNEVQYETIAGTLKFNDLYVDDDD